jgi:multidrug resistance efflux pump
MKTLFKLVTLIAAASLLLSACAQPKTVDEPRQVSLAPDAVVAEGHIVPNDSLYMSFSVRGKVAEILVKEGDPVKEGDVMVRLADREQAEATLAAARLEQVSAQQEYDDFTRTSGTSGAEAWQVYMDAQVARAEAERDWEALNVDNIDERIDDARAEAQDRKKDLDDAQEEFDKYKDLDEDNSSRKQAKDALDNAQDDYNEALRKQEEVSRERDIVRAALDKALADEAEAKRKHEATLSGPDAEKLALLDARLANAKAQVAAAENTLANYELKAPFNGIVTDVNVSVNELIGPEKWAVQVADFSTWYVDTSDLTELEVVKINAGQTVTIVADALPDVKLTGVVDRISQSYKSQGGDILYTVRIKLMDVDPHLRWGMTVEVTFPAAE